ncbi:dna-directed rna subunit e [Vairimorpha apis BRL 01]|uniref:Dna-directed rna subunit e n=1 Tax=Vairimorpha apis BRL 01 TaxID=1037528 RepID=T0L8J2_9MICR|nr:dna-directed rna subunit e [Vairimorpha apis BRL 01]
MNKIQKTFLLIKKSYNHPIIFHTLVNHLSFLMQKLNPLYEIKEDWSKILIYSVTPNKIPNQGIDSKILNLLKKSRKNKCSEEFKLKFMIILYYLKNRPINYLNHLIVFELVSNYLNINDFFDSFILSIFCVSLNSNIFHIQKNKKFSVESNLHLLKKIQNAKFCNTNKYLVLICFVQYDINYYISEIDLQNNLNTFYLFESFCFYAKYCKSEDNILKVLPQNELFLEYFNKFINKEFTVNSEYNTVNLFIEDKELFYRIQNAIEKSENKNKLKNELLEFISNL